MTVQTASTSSHDGVTVRRVGMDCHGGWAAIADMTRCQHVPPWQTVITDRQHVVAESLDIANRRFILP